MSQRFRRRLSSFARIGAEHYLAPRFVKLLQDLGAAVARNESMGLGDTSTLWLVWRDFLGVGHGWGNHVIDDLEIPAKKAKAVEMAVRALRLIRTAKGPKSGIAAWYLKNLKYFKVLEEATTWPPRQQGIQKIGPFDVHDTLGDPKEVEKAKEIVDLAVKAIRKVPVLQKYLYGDLFLVGKIGRPRWAAWYTPSKDGIYLRPKISGVSILESARHLVHEIAHRWWAKSVPDSVKNAWRSRYHKLEHGDVRVPEEGEVFPSWYTVNNRHVKVGPRTPTGFLVVDVRSDEPVAVLSFKTLINTATKISKIERYPSVYSATDPEEYFAEAVSMLAMGTLPAEHEVALREIAGI